jgi:hypothetical protein
VKLSIEGKAGPIGRMGRGNPKSMRVEWMDETKEKEVMQVIVEGIDFETMKTYQGKNVEFA